MFKKTNVKKMFKKTNVKKMLTKNDAHGQETANPYTTDVNINLILSLV